MKGTQRSRTGAVMVALLALAVAMVVGCGGGKGGSASSIASRPALTQPEQDAANRYFDGSDHVNTTARLCAGPALVKAFGIARLDEITKGAAATEAEANTLFDVHSGCVKLNGLVSNALLGDMRRTTEQAQCVHDKGLTKDDVKPLLVAAFRRATPPPLSAAAQTKHQTAVATCIPGSGTTR
jgi:hypothetical protein